MTKVAKPQPSAEPPAITKLAPVRVTEVYDSFWRLAHERQIIYFRRLAGEPAPWTDDAILQRHRFTNAYRAADRVSQYLIRNVIYEGPQEPEEVFFRTILFKLFNRIETWELLVEELGQPRYSDWDFDAYDRVLGEATACGRRIYSAAYIMPPPAGYGHDRKYRNHLALLQRMMEDRLPKHLGHAKSLRDIFDVLVAYPGVGRFLGYQFAVDLGYSEPFGFSEGEFVVPGPGARDGIRKCFSDLGGLSEAEVIRLVVECQETEFARLGLSFRTLWGRRLQLIDCQNLFCEVDKYARVAHPERTGFSGRTRIKQRYQANPKPLGEPWFPPRWGLNEIIAAEREQHGEEVPCASMSDAPRCGGGVVSGWAGS